MGRSTTDEAATIRETLKREHRWSSRQVSVRAEYFSLGSSITVTVKDPAIPLPVVKAVAERAEHIGRCEVTGEILGGGNRYVSVSYSREAQEIIGRRYADAVQRAVNAVEPGSNALQPVEGTEFLIGRLNAGRIALWDRNGYLTDGYTVEQIAGTIGNLVVAREAVPAEVVALAGGEGAGAG